MRLLHNCVCDGRAPLPPEKESQARTAERIVRQLVYDVIVYALCKDEDRDDCVVQEVKEDSGKNNQEEPLGRVTLPKGFNGGFTAESESHPFALEELSESL